MHRTWTGVRAAGLGLLISISLFGCNDKGSSYNPGAGAPGGVGLVNTVPQIAGDWLADATVTSNTCAVLPSIPPDELLFLVGQMDTALEVASITPCQGNIGTLSGTINPSNVINLTSTRTESVGQRCTVERTTTVTAIASNLGDEITGSITVDYTPVNTAGNDCGATYPCLYEQAFAALACPDSGCVLGACPVTAAP